MGVLKVIELMADSDESWEDATKSAVKQAAKSVKNIRSVWVKNQSCNIKDDAVKSFRVTVKVTFEVK
ncbi:MAG: dodecin domain-containing protein [Rhizobiales bacterium]|nr:dodecin domain-containing protein [Hyphomicrobiales bacterium]